MVIVESLEMRKRLCCWLMERQLHISRKEVHELLKIRNTLMERSMKWIDLPFFLSSVRRGVCLSSFLNDNNF